MRILVINPNTCESMTDHIRRELGAVVLDPTSVAFKVAEAMADLGRRHSKAGRFAVPPVKEIK